MNGDERKIIKTKDNWSPAQNDGGKSLRVFLISILVPALTVIGILSLVIANRGGIESSIANLTRFLPVGFAFSAGMVASVNPCGVVMLTSFAFQRLQPNKGKPIFKQVSQGLLHALVVMISFLFIFSIVGALTATGSQLLVKSFPIAGFLIGAGLTFIGIWLLIKKKTLGLNIKASGQKKNRSGVVSALLFGISYAITSLSCTLPIFLVVAGSALSSESALAAIYQFGAYALGMGLVVLIVILGSILFRRGMARWLRQMTPYVHRMSAFFLTAAGLYVMYYWISQSTVF